MKCAPTSVLWVGPSLQCKVLNIYRDAKRYKSKQPRYQYGGRVHSVTLSSATIKEDNWALFSSFIFCHLGPFLFFFHFYFLLQRRICLFAVREMYSTVKCSLHLYLFPSQEGTACCYFAVFLKLPTVVPMSKIKFMFKIYICVVDILYV